MEETPIPRREHWEKEIKLPLWMNSNTDVWWASLNENLKKRLVHEEINNN